MTIPVTLPPAYFDAMYQGAADPWGFEDRWYEQRKYAVSLALLPAARYRRAFEPGCSLRQRLQGWFAHHGEMPDRIVEISSYHAMLGCVVAGMGISLLPRMVLGTFPERKRLSVHPLQAKVNKEITWLVWRKGARSPKLNALIEILMPPPNKQAAKGSRPGNGKIAPRAASGPADLRP